MPDLKYAKVHDDDSEEEEYDAYSSSAQKTLEKKLKPAPEYYLEKEESRDYSDDDDDDDALKKRSGCASCYARMCYTVPLASMVVMTAYYFWLCYTDRPLALALLTIYMIHHSYCYLFHVSFFSLIGQLKIRQAELSNYRELYEERQDQREEDGVIPDRDELAWEDVMHFVILPNYKEDIDILREAIDTLAISTLARNQMGVVLAMEAREPNVQEKAEELMEEYRLKFKFVMATYHPPGLPNEMPGKASNTRWAAQRIWAFMKSEGIDEDRVLFTVADADSDFHTVYFEALTHKFTSMSGDKAKREVTIWQPPIMHYKNYHSQPAVVKLCSLFVTQHELANLSDQSATALPYSTYSITSNLAKRVGGWDPDWISEDWHMFLKCFLNTGGKVTVVPILLPIVNYTPEDDTWWGTVWARWVQAKRHALGIAEMVYYLSSLPSAVAAVQKEEGGCGGICYLFARGIPIIYKMFTVHVVGMGTYWIFSSANGPLLYWVWMHPEEDSLGSWREFWMYLSLYMGLSTTIIFLLMNILNVALYNSISDRIVPPAKNSWTGWIYRNSFPHYIFLLIFAMLSGPLMSTAGGISEWLAAIKTAKSHKFEYEVALKPQAAKYKT